jgi:hypothetical protein
MAFFLAPMLFNSIFHLAASIFFRSYSPGTASALGLFPALCWYLVWLGCDARLLDAISATAAVAIGAAFHALDLALTTFFLRPAPRRATASTPGAGPRC